MGLCAAHACVRQALILRARPALVSEVRTALTDVEGRQGVDEPRADQAARAVEGPDPEDVAQHRSEQPSQALPRAQEPEEAPQAPQDGAVDALDPDHALRASIALASAWGGPCEIWEQE